MTKPARWITIENEPIAIYTIRGAVRAYDHSFVTLDSLQKLINFHEDDDALLTEIYMALDGVSYTETKLYGRKYLTTPKRIEKLREELNNMTAKYTEAANELADLKKQINSE